MRDNCLPSPSVVVGIDPGDAARDLAKAEVAVKYAFTMGRHGPRRLDWTQTQCSRADWLDRGDVGEAQLHNADC